MAEADVDRSQRVGCVGEAGFAGSDREGTRRSPPVCRRIEARLNLGRLDSEDESLLFVGGSGSLVARSAPAAVEGSVEPCGESLIVGVESVVGKDESGAGAGLSTAGEGADSWAAELSLATGWENVTAGCEWPDTNALDAGRSSPPGRGTGLVKAAAAATVSTGWAMGGAVGPAVGAAATAGSRCGNDLCTPIRCGWSASSDVAIGAAANARLSNHRCWRRRFDVEE